jgi:hypothetical protein
MSEDTSPETPLAKSTSEPSIKTSAWRPPASRSTQDVGASLFGAVPENTARFDWAAGSGKVRTFQLNGALGLAVMILVLLVVGALVSVFFVFAAGIGTALALGAGAAAAVGLGARTVRKRLTSAPHRQLSSKD